jgi:ABC-type nitrate/sulfonate/bicarbonate transport system substrate-binding protein
MAFNAKGGAGIGVAAFYGAPRNLALAVLYDSPLKMTELKGKKLGVTAAGSLTDWLTRRLSEHLGHGKEGITPVALGGLEPSLAGLKTRQVDGLVLATEVTYLLEEKKELKPLYNFADLVPDFITHVMFARKEFVAQNP